MVALVSVPELMISYSNDINFFLFLISSKHSHIRSLEYSSQVEELPSLARP